MQCLVLMILFSIYQQTIGGLRPVIKAHNDSEVSVALAEIIKGLKPSHLAILAQIPANSTRTAYDNFDSEENDFLSADIERENYINDFIQQLHKLYCKSIIFSDIELFFENIKWSLEGAIGSVNLIFAPPYGITKMIYERKLAHRLSLFIFYWGIKKPPKYYEVDFHEPLRVIVITRPRPAAFRIYYNQADPNGRGDLALVSWYDDKNLGLSKEPVLPLASDVYSNFNGRILRVPVFHTPPWFWINYGNETNTNPDDFGDFDNDNLNEVNVTGGRDHALLELLAKYMNFRYIYIEAPGRTQGSLRTGDAVDNETYTGGIGLLQSGLADLFLGDVSLSWERSKVIEFSFFTLADSGAFATHARRRLNEALAILRPFNADVWPYLVMTIILSGPIFYIIIILPYKLWLPKTVEDSDKLTTNSHTFHMTHINEITQIDPNKRNRLLINRADNQQTTAILSDNFFNKCLWYTVKLFLKQSCKELHNGYRAKFLTMVYWIAATYVLADVYSAQLTSEFARPAREAPINTLQRLQKVMLEDGYQLFVEKESSSLEMLENGTEIFRQLYALMKRQSPLGDGYLIDSIQAGIQLMADGQENKAIFGGRETLYFNIHQNGAHNFQLSQKLYTRYSAVAVQIGCPFLDSLNDVLIHLFEGGILDKITMAEYELQSRLAIQQQLSQQNTANNMKQNGGELEGPVIDTNQIPEQTDPINTAEESSDTSKEGKQQQSTNQTIQPLNLRMLHGAFIVLLLGYLLASLILLFELYSRKLTDRLCKTHLHLEWRRWRHRIRSTIRYLIIRLLH